MPHDTNYWHNRSVVVTGGAGFIGSHAVDALVAAGANVTVIDDLSSGSIEHLAGVREQIRFIEGDCSDAGLLKQALQGADTLWHLAANPEVRTGATDPRGHVDKNVIVTYELLEAVRNSSVKNVGFTSTSTVYGNADVRPTPESYGPLLPISIYGGAKLACEGLIASYAATFGLNASIWRFANVVGSRSNHGVTFDFVNKLRRDATRLEVLGDGTQCKSYVSVADTVAGMLHSAAAHAPGVAAWNIGSADAIDVLALADIVADTMGLQPTVATQGGTAGGAGWVGDVKHMSLDTRVLQGLGWTAKSDSSEAIRIATQALLDAPAN